MTSFADWQSNILYHFSLCNDLAPFFEGNWSSQTVANTILTDDPPDTPGGETAFQKKIILERMLGLIAQFALSLLGNEIIKQSTNLASIWQRVRRQFNFVQSEVNFLNFANISWKPDEHYETFCQRIVAHLEDNLLTVAYGLYHDGSLPTVDDLAELLAQEQIQVHYTKYRFQLQGRKKANAQSKPSKRKQCTVCESVGCPHTVHDLERLLVPAEIWKDGDSLSSTSYCWPSQGGFWRTFW